MNLAKSIKLALVNANMTQRTLAKSLKTTPAHMSRLANGKAHMNTQVLAHVARLFGMKVSEFVALGED